MKQKQIKIYSFGRKNITDGIITSENLEENIITLTESFLTFAYECYENEKLENGQFIEKIIKVMLPSSEEEAKAEWDNALTFNDKKYYAWFATTGGMKKEDLGKCETIFISEGIKSFADEFEDLISLGKFKEIEKSKAGICINKDVLSRLSLGTSSCYMAGDMPNIIVLPQPKFHLIKDYKTVEKFTEKVKDKKDKEKDRTNYNLVDYNFDDDIDVFDGGAIATPKVFRQIEKKLDVSYDVEFAIIRGYGIGIKGMITKFNILKYLDVFLKENTEYCKKENDKFYLKDMWNEWQEVTDNTMLLNESMVKLAKYYKTENDENMETYKDRLANVDEKYKDIIEKLYVTKINKKDEDIENYRRLNYQLLTALALSKKNYVDLIKEDIKTYRKILKPFDKTSDKEEWQINIDSIRLFFKNIIKNHDEESEEFQEEVKNVSNSVVNKCEELLNISEEFINLKFVKNNLAKLIEKKCRELACGKVTAKAKYQYISVDPISYMNYAMFRDQKEDGLKEGEFYSYDCSDGDACTIIDSDIIRSAVLVPKDSKYFLNKDDGHKELMEYNKENIFLATYRASGNLIGSIALKSASINSNSQQTYDYYDTVNKKFLLYGSLKDDKESKEAYEKEKNEKLESGEWITTYKASEQHREHINQRFYENEKDIYIVLYNAMVSIDAPKTLYFPSKSDMEIINDKYSRKAWFLQYKENKENVDTRHYQLTFGLLDSITNLIKNELLNEINSITKKFDNKAALIQKKLINGDYIEKEYNDCFDDIEKMYKDYTEKRKNIDSECYKKSRKETKFRDEMLNNSCWSQWEEDEYEAKIKSFKAEKYKQYKEVDSKYIVMADGILNTYKIVTISNAIGNMKNCTEDFIINLFYPVFYYLNDKVKADRYFYKKAEDVDITYLYEKYKKIKIEAIDNSNIVMNLHLEEKKRLDVIDVKKDVRARVLDSGVIELIKSELQNNGHVYFGVKVIEDKVILLKDEKQMLQVFDDWIQINEYNLLKCSSIKFEILGEIAKSKKSLKLTATEIAI
ncbi:hypothetical protein [Clostridium arbusti]|uniref:hypothetical protein n=1 Tax=Clostridium arbusti TaxID=1137848 RepID=UPI000289054C|nr:hypothetical protein [Clostridium arbusti]